MNNLTSDYIAVDTNVFQHLLNPRYNKDNRIFKLLNRFMEDNISLLVDSEKQIQEEYLESLWGYIKKTAKEGKGEGKILRKLLDSPKKVLVNLSDELMTCITKTVPETRGKGIDRLFVYVAFKTGKFLITNDKEDMIDNGHRKDEKRKELRKCRSHKNRKADILTSEEAYYKL